MTVTALLKQIIALSIAASAGFELRHYSSGNAALEPAGTTAFGVIDAMDKLLEEANSPRRNHRLRHLLAGISDREIHAALTRLGTKKDDWVFRNLELELLARWTATDPHAAIGWIDKLPGDFAINATFLVAAAWLENDETAALAWAETRSQSLKDRSGRHAVLSALAARNPRKAIALLEARPKLGNVDGWGSVFSTLVARNFNLAVMEANRLPEGRNRNKALMAIANFLTHHDPGASERWIKHLPPGPARYAALGNLLMSLNYRNPKEAVRIAMTEKAAGWDRTDRVRQAVWLWSEKEPAAAKEWVEQLPDGNLRRETTLALVTVWSEKEPKAALDYALEIPNAPAKMGIAGFALAQWMGDDFENGMRWFEARANEVPPDIFLKAADFLRWKSPANAATLLEKLPDGAQRNEAYQYLASEWTRKDPEAAAAWLEEMAEGPGRDEFMKGYFSATASADVTQAVQRFATLPESPVRASVAADIAAAWAKADPDAASGWIKTLPTGSLRDSALQRFSTTLSATDPAKAASWAMTISEPDKRLDTIRKVARHWLNQDPAAAKAWINSAAIPEDWKARMLK